MYPVYFCYLTKFTKGGIIHTYSNCKGEIKVKLKVTKKGEANVAEKEKQVRRGKNNKAKGANFERDVAKHFSKVYGVSLVRTPLSGGFAKCNERADSFRGDIVPADDSIDLALHIECKNSKSWSLPKWFEQAESDCPKGKVPCVIFHKHGTSKDYISLSLDDFFKLVPTKSIIRRKSK